MYPGKQLPHVPGVRRQWSRLSAEHSLDTVQFTVFIVVAICDSRKHNGGIVRSMFIVGERCHVN